MDCARPRGLLCSAWAAQAGLRLSAFWAQEPRQVSGRSALKVERPGEEKSSSDRLKLEREEEATEACRNPGSVGPRLWVGTNHRLEIP